MVYPYISKHSIGYTSIVSAKYKKVHCRNNCLFFLLKMLISVHFADFIELSEAQGEVEKKHTSAISSLRRPQL